MRTIEEIRAYNRDKKYRAYQAKKDDPAFLEKKRESARRWRDSNRERMREIYNAARKKYYDKKREKKIEYTRAYMLAHPDKRKEYAERDRARGKGEVLQDRRFK